MFEIAAKSDPGKKRTVNEDAFYVDPNKGIFIVADGMGGHGSGNRASKLAIDKIVEYLYTIPLNKIDVSYLERAIDIANRAIYEASKKDFLTMGTTIVSGVIKQGKFLVAHVGD